MVFLIKTPLVAWLKTKVNDFISCKYIDIDEPPSQWRLIKVLVALQQLF